MAKRIKYHAVIVPCTNHAGDYSHAKEFVSNNKQISDVPDGWKCIGVTGFHEENK